MDDWVPAGYFDIFKQHRLGLLLFFYFGAGGGGVSKFRI